MQRVFVFFIVFLALNIISYSYLHDLYDNKKEAIAKNQVQDLDNLYHSSITTFRLNAKAVFENIILQPEVLNILRKLPNATDTETTSLHNQLYELLEKRYENLRTFLHVRQLHFHHADGRSFLRMHRPNK